MLSYTIALLASFWISHRWNHAILSNLFWFVFLLHTERCLYGDTALPHSLLYHVSFYDWYIIYVSPSDGHEGVVQPCGTTQEAFFCMSSGAYENLSRAVAFKLFWPWLIVRNGIGTPLHTYMCIKLRGGGDHKTKTLWLETHSYVFSVCDFQFLKNHSLLNWFQNSWIGASRWEQRCSVKDMYRGTGPWGREMQMSNVVNWVVT